MKRLFLFGTLILGLPIAQASLYQVCENGTKACPAPRWYLDVQLGGYRLNAPEFAFGQILVAGLGVSDIREFSIDHDRITGFYPKLAAGFEFDGGFCPCFVGTNFFIEIGVFYSCFERLQEDNAILPSYAFPRLEGNGDFLASGETSWFSAMNFERKYEYGGAQFQLGSNILCRQGRLFVIPFLEVDVNSVNQRYEVRAPSITGQFPVNHFEVDEKLTTVYWDFGLGFDFDYHLSPCCRSFFIFGQATGFLSHAETFFSGKERVLTPIIPATAPSLIHQKLCLFSGKARAQLGIGYQFGENFSISLVGQVDYWGYIPFVRNPHRIEHGVGGVGVYDGPAHIGKTSTTNFALFAEICVLYF